LELIGAKLFLYDDELQELGWMATFPPCSWLSETLSSHGWLHHSLPCH
jgi:hypothetical protein